MPNEMFTDLPTVTNSLPADIICAVQGGVSVQQTLAQVSALSRNSTVLNFAGNPNGNLAGVTYQLCWDTTNDVLYVCTTSGNAATAVWTLAGSVTFPVTATNGGTGVSNPTQHGILVAQGAAPVTPIVLTNGQLLIGSTGNDPVAATLTAGANISIVNTPGGIEIAGTGLAGFSWNIVTGVSEAMLPNNGYITDNVGLVTLTLPLTSAVGDEIDIIGKGAGMWTIAQNAGQSIVFGNTTTTVGVGGSLSATNAKDSFYMICTVADTEWTVASGTQGILTVV